MFSLSLFKYVNPKLSEYLVPSLNVLPISIPFLKARGLPHLGQQELQYAHQPGVHAGQQHHHGTGRCRAHLQDDG